MSLATDALTTVEKTRLYIKRRYADESADEILEPLINAASAAIHVYCKRQFEPQDSGTNVAKKFRYDGLGLLSFAIARTELATVTSVVLHTDKPSAQQRTLANGDGSTESEYRLEPRTKTGEATWLSIVLPVLTQREQPDLEGYEVTVTGKWGAGLVPAPVELACWMTVASWYVKNLAGSLTNLGGLGDLGFHELITSTKEEALPRGARLLLDPYARIVAG